MTNEDKNDDLMHYASPYYDPVKAHEYYMRTRQLKGRRSTANLNDSGKEIWSYTKQQINAEKKAKDQKNKESRDKKIAAQREKAKALRERIAAKLKQLNEKLAERAKKEREQLAAERKEEQEQLSEDSKRQREATSKGAAAEIERIRNQKIPEGLSKEERARYVAARNQEIARIRGNAAAQNQLTSENTRRTRENVGKEYSAKTKKVSEAAKAERKDNSESAKVQREKVATDLKNVITATREAYKKSKTNLNTAYEKILDNEYNKIVSEHRKVTKRKSS